MKRDDIKEFIELLSGYKKSSRMLAEAEGDEDTAADSDAEAGDDADADTAAAESTDTADGA